MNERKGKLTGMTFFKTSEETWNKLQAKTLLTLNRDRQNQYDKNAIQVLYNRKQIAWVAKEDNVLLAPLLDTGTIITTEITRVFGTPYDRPHIEISYTWMP